ncbi:GPI inositol-deacylase [Etheostoma cragini]|uniref:GPI inositol-deacylase n=1 Tax=Etheostoma cragini TaxID=417921 RepID=UPI00155EAF2C|nr:GPI inositol-deacylase [Etheostoma cragini]
MKLAPVAFYGFALGLLAVGLRELLTGFEENRCSMTYMFEYPEYRVSSPRRVARLYPAYGLYLYGEGLYAQETRALKLTGAPVLFLPGNAGSYKQGEGMTGMEGSRDATRSIMGVLLTQQVRVQGQHWSQVGRGLCNDQADQIGVEAGQSEQRPGHHSSHGVTHEHHALRGGLQFTVDPEKKMAVLHHHFIRHPVRMLGDSPDSSVSMLDFPEAWSEVNTLRLAYSTPKEGQVRYFLFALSSRRKAYSHFYCRSNSMEMTSWVYGCMHKNGSSCVRAVDLSMGTELLPPYKVLVLSLSDLSLVTHLVVSASNLNGKQFTVECEWQRQESQTVSVSAPHVLSFGLTVSDVSVNSSGLLHTIELENFDQVYQALRINVASQCKVHQDRLPNVYRINVPWFREDSLTTASVPSVTEISGMLHTSRPDNASGVLLQLHTAPNCQYKVSIRTSLPRVLGQILRFCGPLVPVYTAVTLLLACGGQLSSILDSRRAAGMSQVVAKGLQPHKVNLLVYILHLLLRCNWFQEIWSVLYLPPMDALPPTTPDATFHEGVVPVEEWPHLLSPLLYILGAAVAFWGSALLRLVMRLISLILAPLHRPSVSRDCGTVSLRSQVLITLGLAVVGGLSCGPLSISAAFLLHLYRVLRLQMTERSLSHMLNLVPRKNKEVENGTVDAEPPTKSKECNGAPLLSECALQEVRDDLQLHLCLSALFTLPVMLIAPSLIHWIRNLRYSTQLDPDPCWPHTVPLIIVYMLLINCNTLKLSTSKLLPLTSCLPLPLSIAMVTFSPLHLYRVTYFLLAALVPLASCCVL